MGFVPASLGHKFGLLVHRGLNALVGNHLCPLQVLVQKCLIQPLFTSYNSSHPVGRMNNIRFAATEIVNTEIIYA